MLGNEKNEELVLREEREEEEEIELEKVLRQVDCICFYIEQVKKKGTKEGHVAES